MKERDLISSEMGHGHYIEPAFGREVHRVGAGERLDLDFVILPGQPQDLHIEVDLVGEGAEVNLRGLYLCPSDEHVSITVILHHRVPGCRSSQLFKGIVGGTAKVRFDGTIIVAPDAQQTEAYQENHNILLTETALVETSPQLEIYADDVKCSHGATVGRLNEEEQFYMRSRGIPEAEAKILQMISFLAPVTSHLPETQAAAIESALRSIL